MGLQRANPNPTGWFSGASLIDSLAAFPSPAPGGAGVTLDAGDKWVEVLRRQQLPEVVVFANFLNPSECDALIEAARPRLSRSLTVDTRTGCEALHPDRTSQGMFFERFENDVVLRVEKRIAKLLRWPAQHGEGLQVLRYRKGAQYLPHYDYFDPREAGTPALLARGGQRVATLIMYLATPQAGGATVFPDLGLQVIPKRGQAVFFSYTEPLPSSRSLHGGEPVTAGEKWIATKWLRQHEFT
jgi:prolyl 4-hydroxylase